MSSNGCTYRFIESTLSGSTDQIIYDIEIRQQPQRAKVSLINERDRRSIEPPPILQLHWRNCSEDELKKSLQSPFYFIVANLVTEDDTETPLVPVQNYLSGTTVSSLYRLRDIDNSDGGFFVFGDLAVKREGKFKLRFSLFEIVEGQVKNRKTILSNTFTVYIPKQFPGPVEATFLSRTFSDQGVKMRIRKEHRLQSRKRKSDAATKEVAEHKRVTRKYHSKHIDMMVASSSHLEPVNNSNSDVFFGKWQVASRTPHPRPSTPLLLPSTPNNTNHSDDHLQSFPSPESTVYSSTSSGWHHQQQQQQEPVHQQESAIYRSEPSYRSEHTVVHRQEPTVHHSEPVHRPIPMRETAYRPSSSPHVASIPPQYRSSIASPPFKSIASPSNSSLAQYHTCHDSPSQPLSAVKRLPTPPSCFSEIPREKHWGTTLPPLRAIMNSTDPFHSETSSLFPLLLPPPSTRIVANKPFFPHY
ncbi:hypothetical protein A0J61_02938 [Choanephora cucurbitarum]|uniref:Velvet domain-containing protein n=1 Tax=Choanephora cucurbitarum TaxID=101091 RepID=A0A1C7NJ34_9FUNG|nr:hypothetical protein A0J61_02938 [Choanephora cucurbitarum]